MLAKKIHRPLSPHLGIYKPQISSTLSIFHRISGVTNFLSMLALTWWVVGVAFESGNIMQSCIWQFFSTIWGQMILMGLSFSIFLHFCTGVRHLFWDCGLGFEVKTMTITGWIAIITAITLTAITWLIIFNITR